MQKNLIKNLLIGIVLASLGLTAGFLINSNVQASGIPVIVVVGPPSGTPTDTPTPTLTPTATETPTPTLSPTASPSPTPGIIAIIDVYKQDTVGGHVNYMVVGENFQLNIKGYINGSRVDTTFVDANHAIIALPINLVGDLTLRMVNPGGDEASKPFTIPAGTVTPQPTTDNQIFITGLPTATPKPKSQNNDWLTGTNGLLSFLPLNGIVLSDNTVVVLTPNQIASTGGVSVVAVAGSVEYLKYFFIPMRKRKRFWGLAIDEKTEKGVPLVVINLVNAATKHIVASTITDMQGRYGLVVDPGEYYLEIEHPEYRLTKEVSGNGNYLGQNFKIEKTQNLAYNFLLSQTKESKFSFRVWFGTIWNNIVSVFEKLYPYLILATIIADLYFFTLSKDPTYIFLIIWLLVFLVVFFGLAWYYPKQWGVCVDAGTGKPIPHAIVKLYSIKDVAPVDTQISDDYGRFQFVTSQGEYQVIAMASGYQFPAKSSKHLDKEGRFLVKTNRGKYNYDLVFDKIAQGTGPQPVAKFGMLNS